ncbi:unnamed protein product [Triticum turgidum subsp. durum]|uniref:Trafficking protein particle complex subunit n=1 Tax=Triticum turgidum subsp. durum TaxID=4567 RepID=A0A9R0TMV7_TRITD|nr:unnamed protein product [Triticum turgidum subsp. durum]
MLKVPFLPMGYVEAPSASRISLTCTIALVADPEKYTMERPRFTDHLEAIKFICKDFWSELFKKQIDNLKTNHRGTFVLQDNHFRWLTRVSLDPAVESTDATENDSGSLGDSAAQTTSMLLYFPCGLIRGALTNLGIPCAVSADMSNLPACELNYSFP